MNVLAAALQPFARSARQQEKEAQINALLVGFHGNADFRPNKPDQKSYEVVIRHANKTFSTLVIRIPETFPDAKPDIVVKGHIASGHPWVTPQYGTVRGCARLNDWNKSVSSLCDIVKEIVAVLEAGVGMPANMPQQPSRQEAMPPMPPAAPSSSSSSSYSQQQQQPQLQHHPQHGSVLAVNEANSNPIARPSSWDPLPAPSSSSAGGASQPLAAAASSSSSSQRPHSSSTSSTGSSSSSSSFSVTASPSSSSHHTQKPPLPTAFENLQQLSEAQLERLLHDDVSIQASLQSLAEVASLREYRDGLRKKNHEMAARTLQRHDDFERAHSEVLEAQRELQSLATQYAAKLGEKKRLILTEREVWARAEAQCRVLDASSLRVKQKLFDGAVPPEGLRQFLQVCVPVRCPTPSPTNALLPSLPDSTLGIPAGAHRVLWSQGKARIYPQAILIFSPP